MLVQLESSNGNEFLGKSIVIRLPVKIHLGSGCSESVRKIPYN